MRRLICGFSLPLSWFPILFCSPWDLFAHLTFQISSPPCLMKTISLDCPAQTHYGGKGEKRWKSGDNLHIHTDLTLQGVFYVGIKWAPHKWLSCCMSTLMVFSKICDQMTTCVGTIYFFTPPPRGRSYVRKSHRCRSLQFFLHVNFRDPICYLYAKLKHTLRLRCCSNQCP